MTQTEALIADFTFELAKTREVLARLPQEHWAWKPHEKSWTLGQLASHLGEFPVWAVMTISSDELDLMPEGQPLEQRKAPEGPAELLAAFDEGVKNALAATAGLNDEALGKPWRLLVKGQEKMVLPKLGVLRGMVLHHMVHHRGQLTIYLRLLNIPLPALYGPSADEGQNMFA